MFLKRCTKFQLESHIKRQATQQGCLSSLLGDGDKGSEIVHSEEKNIFYWADQSSQGRTKISCTGATSLTNQPRKGPFHLYSLNPHSPEFQQSERGYPLQSLWLHPTLCALGAILPIYVQYSNKENYSCYIGKCKGNTVNPSPTFVWQRRKQRLLVKLNELPFCVSQLVYKVYITVKGFMSRVLKEKEQPAEIK